MDTITETRTLKMIANDLINALGSESKADSDAKESTHQAHQRVCSFINEIWVASSNPLAYLSTVMESYTGSDKEIVKARKLGIERAVKTARELDIVGIYDRSTKLYTFQIKPEKVKTFEEFCVELKKKIEKSGFNPEAVMLQVQEMLESDEAVIERVDPLDKLI